MFADALTTTPTAGRPQLHPAWREAMSNPYDVDPVREQESEDFVKNLRPWVDSLQAVKDAGDKLFEEFGAGTREGEYLDGVLDTLDDTVRHARDRLNSDAEDIAAGTLDVPTTSKRSAA